MPRTKRPADATWSVTAAAAVTAGCRVTGFVTAVPRRSRSVSRAASARPTQGSPARFWESTTARPSKPAPSARAAARSTAPGHAMPVVQISGPATLGTLGPARRRPAFRWRQGGLGDSAPSKEAERGGGEHECREETGCDKGGGRGRRDGPERDADLGRGHDERQRRRLEQARRDRAASADERSVHDG